MINIRYHIVSITAVFLALGIGVALGSTFLDGATVDVLNRNITNAEAKIDLTNAANERLRSEVADARERDEALILLGSEDLVADHLSGVPTLVVAAPGVDQDELDPLSTVLERTGADLRGTLKLNDRLGFEGNEVDAELAEELGIDAESPEELRAEVNHQLVDALTAAGEPVVDEPEPVADGRPEVLDALIERDYVQLDVGPELADDAPVLDTTGYRYVFVGQPGLAVDRNQILLDLLPADEDDEALPAVVISRTVPTPEGEEAQEVSVVDQLRSDELRSERYSTVDIAETFAGLVSVVYVVEQVDVLTPDHYGQGEGASAVLPPVP